MKDDLIENNDDIKETEHHGLLYCPYFEMIPDSIKSIITWKYPYISAAVFIIYMAITLMVRWMSLVSVVAYLGLAILAYSVMVKLYCQFVLSDASKHPFESYLEGNLSKSFAEMKELVEGQLDNDESHFYRFLNKWRKLVLLENYLDVVKFGALMMIMIYVGAWVNLLDLVDLSVISSMIIPVIYIHNQEKVDRVLLNLMKEASKLLKNIRAKMSTLPLIGSKLKTQ